MSIKKKLVVTGGSQGLGLAIVETFLAQSADVVAIARDGSMFSAAQRCGARMIQGNAADASLMNRVIEQEQPDVLVLNAGASLPMKPIDQQSWEEFSSTWNTDVKATLVGIQAALLTPMKPGGRVVIVSSGASMVLSHPAIAPENLRLSGGYTGAKRMQWFMAHQANTVAAERGLGLRFQVILPGQLIPATALGRTVAQAYAQIEGVSVERHVLDRYGSILAPDEVAQRVAELLSEPHRAGVAFAIRAGAPLMSVDVP